MPNSIFTKILDDTIKQFVTEFSNMPRELFYDEADNLFHPGEYGKYREEIIRKLFRSVLYEDLHVSEGFLINLNNQHSTQCDIIIYDKRKTPILKDSNNIFIPVETAVGVGEIKSTLTKTKFKSALRHLANNKQLKEFADGKKVKREKIGDYSPKEECCDQLFSFLICKNLSFDINNLDFDEIYEGIEYRNRHNLILSIDDGLFQYEFDFNLISKDRKRIYESQGVNTNKTALVEYPNWLKSNCRHYFVEKIRQNPIGHVREFISSLYFGIHYATILDVDIRQYYREVPRDVFLK